MPDADNDNDPRFRPHPAVLFIVEHLPDSMRHRKELLKDCLSLLGDQPEDDPMKTRIQQLHDFLEMHEQLQAELSLRFPDDQPDPPNDKPDQSEQS